MSGLEDAEAAINRARLTVPIAIADPLVDLPLILAAIKITLAEVRQMGVRGVLIYCCCGHHVAFERGSDEARLSDIEPRFICKACGRRGAEAALFGIRRLGKSEVSPLHDRSSAVLGRTFASWTVRKPQAVRHLGLSFQPASELGAGAVSASRRGNQDTGFFGRL